MRLVTLLAGIDYQIYGKAELEIRSLSFSSKDKNKNNLFFCISGTKTDGVLYYKEAFANGSIAFVTEKEIKDNKITQVIVKNVRVAMARIASNFYNNPEKKLKVIGITGTNGKTSTSYIIASLLTKFNKKIGIIGTSGINIDGKEFPSHMTTPDSLELFKFFSLMVESDVEYCIMEVSAHAIFLEKTSGINFAVKVLTNVESDHLDFFGSLKSYRDTKIKFFDSGEKYVVNGDDSVGKLIKNKYGNKTLSFGVHQFNDLVFKDIHLSIKESNWVLLYNEFIYKCSSKLIGQFNIYNALAGVAVLLSLQFNINEIVELLKKVRPVPGRFDMQNFGQNFNVIIDYAHTVDSLRKLLETVDKLERGKKIIVLGCPGERETQKRRTMGIIAGKFCEYVVITSDNPASENPRRIMREIESGVKTTGTNYSFIEDRERAVKKALTMAKQGDTVLLVGKGVENYQKIGDDYIPYCDYIIVEKFFKKHL